MQYRPSCGECIPLVRGLAALTIIVACSVAGCDTRDFSESRTAIVVASRTVGTNIDPNGYSLLLDGQLRGTLSPNDTTTLEDLVPGSYLVSIDDVALNCLVHESVERHVTLRAGERVGILFEVTCTDQPLHIVFESDRDGGLDIYSANFSTNLVTRLTTHPLADYAAAVSPDERILAFTSRRDGNLEIYLLNRSGGALQNLTRHDADDRSPSFSPDGQWITFVSDRSGPPSV